MQVTTTAALHTTPQTRGIEGSKPMRPVLSIVSIVSAQFDEPWKAWLLQLTQCLSRQTSMVDDRQ